jgi:hypothetical protein
MDGLREGDKEGDNEAEGEIEGERDGLIDGEIEGERDGLIDGEIEGEREAETVPIVTGVIILEAIIVPVDTVMFVSTWFPSVKLLQHSLLRD